MQWSKWIVFSLAFIESGWFVFDACHAFVTGNYVTSKSGSCNGQLGPWSKVVSAFGIDPRSTMMKSTHLGLGLAGLIVVICFALQLSWSWIGMLIWSFLGLWYLPFGTLFGIIQIILLLRMRPI